MTHEATSLRTKQALAASLKKLMSKKPFSKITVSEIIADCDVNRKTFYYHFEDIYALMKWLFEQEALAVMGTFDMLTDYEEAINFAIDYVTESEHLIACAYDALGRDGMRHFFRADFLRLMNRLISRAEEVRGICLEPDFKAFVAEFYTEAIAGMLIDWIKHPAERNREKMLEYLVRIHKASLLGLLK